MDTVIVLRSDGSYRAFDLPLGMRATVTGGDVVLEDDSSVSTRGSDVDEAPPGAEVFDGAYIRRESGAWVVVTPLGDARFIEFHAARNFLMATLDEELRHRRSSDEDAVYDWRMSRYQPF